MEKEEKTTRTKMKKAGLRKQGQEHLESVLEGMCVCEAVHGALRAQEGAEVHFQRNENGVNVERGCYGLSVSNMDGSNHTGFAKGWISGKL